MELEWYCTIYSTSQPRWAGSHVVVVDGCTLTYCEHSTIQVHVVVGHILSLTSLHPLLPFPSIPSSFLPLLPVLLPLLPSTQYGDNHLKEVESLWCALCTWPQNIRATLNYLAHLTCVSGNVALMLHQAKRVMVCFSQKQTATIVTELMRDLQVGLGGERGWEEGGVVCECDWLFHHWYMQNNFATIPFALCPSFSSSLPPHRPLSLAVSGNDLSRGTDTRRA